MRISDWSSDVCSSDLPTLDEAQNLVAATLGSDEIGVGRIMIEQCLLVFGEPEEPCLLSSPFDRGAVGRELAPFPLDQFLLVVKRLVANRIPALIAIEIEVAGSGHALPQRLGGGVMIGFDSADESIMRDVQFRSHILKIAGHFDGECADRDA